MLLFSTNELPAPKAVSGGKRPSGFWPHPHLAQKFGCIPSRPSINPNAQTSCRGLYLNAGNRDSNFDIYAGVSLHASMLRVRPDAGETAH